MSPKQRQEIKIHWLNLSLYYQVQLRDEVFEMYVDDLEGLDPVRIVQAMESYRRNPKNLRMPLPSQIIALCQPEDDDDSQANESASRIRHAIQKYGYTNEPEAKIYIGALGWSVVEKQGGWQNLCEDVRVNQFTIYQAQWRELAKAQIRRARAGILDQPPALPPAQARIDQGKQRLLAKTIIDLSEEKKLE